MMKQLVTCTVYVPISPPLALHTAKIFYTPCFFYHKYTLKEKQEYQISIYMYMYVKYECKEKVTY